LVGEGEQGFSLSQGRVFRVVGVVVVVVGVSGS
jgi:hypothetical protein